MIMVVVIMMMKALAIAPVLLGRRPALSELASNPSSGTEHQRVHDGAGHQLDDPRRHHLLLARAGWTLGVVAVCGGGRYGQRVQVLGEVVVAVGQLRGHWLDVLCRGEVDVCGVGGRTPRRARAMTELDGGRLERVGVCASWGS